MSGNKVDLLAQTNDASMSSIQLDLDALSGAMSRTETSAKALLDSGSETGLEGTSGAAAADACLAVANKLIACVDQIKTVAVAGEAARQALLIAKAAHADLPPMSMPQTINQYIYNVASTSPDATISLSEIGTVPASQAESLWYAERERRRNAAAAAALTQLQADMNVAVADLVGTHDGSGYDPNNLGGTSPGTGGRHTTGTGTVTGTTGAPAVGSGLSGSGSSGLGDGSSSGLAGAGTIGSSYGSGGSGSADGSVGGNVPGSTGTGGTGGLSGLGGYTGSGGSGGLLAGGVSVAGVAVGAGALGRMGGLGGLGGLGVGTGGGGGVVGGAGARGAGIGGTTGSGLVAGSSTSAAAGGAGARGNSTMGGMPMGGGGAGGSANKRRGPGGHLMAPDLDIEETEAAPDLGPGAHAGDRDRLPPAADAFDEPELDDDHW